jgi:hypothetical protein
MSQIHTFIALVQRRKRRRRRGRKSNPSLHENLICEVKFVFLILHQTVFFDPKSSSLLRDLTNFLTFVEPRGWTH